MLCGVCSGRYVVVIVLCGLRCGGICCGVDDWLWCVESVLGCHVCVLCFGVGCFL